MATAAEAIFETVKYLQEIYRQVDALVGTLKADLDVPGWAAGEWNDDEYEPGHPWLYTGVSLTRVVRKKTAAGRGAPRRIGALTICIDLGEENGLAALFGRSVVIVGWVGRDDDEWELANFTSDERTTLELHSPQLVRYIDPDDAKTWRKETLDGEKVGWFYVLPLDTFTDRGDLSRLIAGPVSALTTGATPEKAFKEVPEALRFRQEPGGALQPG